MRRKWIFLVPAAILGIALFTFIGGQVVMLLWNWLGPTIFGWPEITFWQAIGILALCRILFGGFGRHAGHRSKMTPEQRERFHQRMRDRFGFGPAASEISQIKEL